jgi:tryptophan synthase beta chain
MSAPATPNTFRTGPDEHGHFGIYGGRFVAETLMPLVLELEQAYAKAKADPAFQKEMDGYLKHYVGRPSPLYFAERLTAHLGGAKDLFQARGAQSHRRAQGEQRARPDHGLARPHGQEAHHRRRPAPACMASPPPRSARASASTASSIWARSTWSGRRPNVFRMQMLGAKWRRSNPVTRTLKDAMNEALRDWVTNVADTFYASARWAGPHPYPMMVRDFQCVIGRETRAQIAGSRRAACRIR